MYSAITIISVIIMAEISPSNSNRQNKTGKSMLFMTTVIIVTFIYACLLPELNNNCSKINEIVNNNGISNEYFKSDCISSKVTNFTLKNSKICAEYTYTKANKIRTKSKLTVFIFLHKAMPFCWLMDNSKHSFG